MMRFSRNLLIFSGLGIFIAVLYSCNSGFERTDENSLRAIFHIPNDAELLSIEGNPKQSGWFGREGLMISAIFQLNDQNYASFVASTQNLELWKPSPETPTKPAPDKEYSQDSLKWKLLPLPDFLQNSPRIQRIASHALPEVKKGYYFCTVSKWFEPRQGKYSYSYFQRLACEEAPELKGWKFTLGILDAESKKLYVEYN